MNILAQLAQLVERLLDVERVSGSSPLLCIQGWVEQCSTHFVYTRVRQPPFVGQMNED